MRNTSRKIDLGTVRDRQLRSQNIDVVWGDQDKTIIEVYLYGKKMAEMDQDYKNVKLFGGHNWTYTTRQAFNTLLRECGFYTIKIIKGDFICRFHIKSMIFITIKLIKADLNYYSNKTVLMSDITEMVNGLDSRAIDGKLLVKTIKTIQKDAKAYIINFKNKRQSSFNTIGEMKENFLNYWAKCMKDGEVELIFDSELKKAYGGKEGAELATLLESNTAFNNKTGLGL